MCEAARDADVVLAETPSNPGLDVVDLHHLAMQCRPRGALLVVDNTTATPLGQQPLSLGADLVVASATKALAGHHDLLAGYVAGNRTDVMERLQRERLLAGPILGAFEAWLVLRGLGTLGLRFERQCQNAAALAMMLRSHPAVAAVRYPGLPDDPSHAIAARQMRRFGASSRSSWPTPMRCTSWCAAARCSSEPPASAACTARSTAGRGGAMRYLPASPVSPVESRTPTTCSPISSRPSPGSAGSLSRL